MRWCDLNLEVGSLKGRYINIRNEGPTSKTWTTRANMLAA